MSAAITAAVVVAGGAAYAANKQAKAQKAAAKAASQAANQPWNNTSSTTTTSTPYGNSGANLDYALDQARALYDAQTAPKGKKGKGGGGGGGAPTGPSKTTRGVVDQIVKAGTANPANLGAANKFINSALTDPFAGNGIRADLAGRLGNASFDRSAGLIDKFLAGSDWNQGGGNDGADPNDPSGPSRGSSGPVFSRTSSYYDSPSFGGGNGGLNDTHTGSWADRQSDWFFDDARLNPEDDPTMAAVIAGIRREHQEDLDRQIGEIGDEYDSRGMYGSSLRALEGARTREEGSEALADALARTYMDQRNRNLDARQGLLGIQAQRDIAGTNADVQRQGISASSAASAAGLEGQLGLARRGQDLDAIRLLMGHDEFGLNQLGDLSGDLSADRFGALGAMPAINKIKFDNLGAAFGASSGLDQLDAQARQQAWMRAQQQANKPGQLLDDYLRRIALVGGMGGSSTSTTTASGVGGQTTPSQFYNGPSPGDAGWAAGIGALAQGLSAWGQNRNTAAPSGRA